MREAEGWLAEHGRALVGLPADRAAAAAGAAGLRVRSVPAGGAVTLDHRPDRVTLSLDADGAVASVRAG